MVYLIHFDTKLHHAGHYIGYTESLVERLEDHAAKKGAKILAHLRRIGVGYKVVRVWEGKDGNFERSLKNLKNAPRLCPVCNPVRFMDTPRPEADGRQGVQCV